MEHAVDVVDVVVIEIVGGHQSQDRLERVGGAAPALLLDLIEVDLDVPLVRSDLEERLPLMHDGAVGARDQDLVDGPGEGRPDRVEHLHDLDDIERLPLVEMHALGHKARAARRLLPVVHAAADRHDLVGLGGRRRDQDLFHAGLEVRIGEVGRDGDLEIRLDAEVEEPRLVRHHEEQAEQLVAGLVAQVGRTDERPGLGVVAALRGLQRQDVVELVVLLLL